jgi:hypothetical protein
MAGLLLIVSTTEPGRYVYLKYGVARKNSDVILDRRKEDRRRIHQAAATPERRYGDRAIATSRGSFRRSAGRWRTG